VNISKRGKTIIMTELSQLYPHFWQLKYKIWESSVSISPLNIVSTMKVFRAQPLRLRISDTLNQPHHISEIEDESARRQRKWLWLKKTEINYTYQVLACNNHNLMCTCFWKIFNF
jgi:hypothetical protein